MAAKTVLTTALPMIFPHLAPILLFGMAAAVYDPSSDFDWKQLKPRAPPPAGSVLLLPFPIGMVTQNFYLDDDGIWRRPEPLVPETVVPSVPGENSRKWADIHQLDIGQVLRPEGEEEEHYVNDPWETQKPPEEVYDGPWTPPEQHNEDYKMPEEIQAPEDFEDDQNEPWDVSSPIGGPVNVVPEDMLMKRGIPEARGFHPIRYTSCTDEDTLVMYLEDGILRDPEHRIGSIVSNRQFQFDGPTPQYGAIYAAGWLVTKGGLLSLGEQTTFWQCLAGDFHKTYDRSIHEQCVPVQFEVVKLDMTC